MRNANSKFKTMPVNGNCRVKANVSQKETEAILRAPMTPSNPAITIDINEQIILAKFFGINPTNFCFEYTRCDTLFAAYVFAFEHERGKQIPSSPSLIETFLQRASIAAIATSRSEILDDISSRLWADLFKYYHENGVDVISAHILYAIDGLEIVDII